MKKQQLSSVFFGMLIFTAVQLSAQVAINTDDSQPDQSAMLDVKSTLKGILVPRLTTAERDAISNPANGLLIFCTNNNQYYTNKGTQGSPNWVMISTQWLSNGSQLFYNLGNVGIGTTNPQNKLDISGNAVIGATYSGVYAATTNGLLVEGKVGIGTPNPSATAALEINSSISGFLPPRMTTVQRNAIVDPEAGLTIYNIDLNCLEFYSGTANGWYCPCPGYGTLSCVNVVVNGTYNVGVALTSSNTVTLNVTVNTPGTFTLFSNNVTGFEFSKSLIFTSVGSQTVTLNGNGTPTASGTFEFTVIYGNSYCNFFVTVNGLSGQPCPGLATISYGGQLYNTVQIGTQCWLKENLNIGSKINGSQQQTNNSIIEKYCYNNDDSKCTVYGGLYQWSEMMQYLSSPGIQGICPTGWHIPTDFEWNILTDFLGGEIVAGGKIKEAGLAHWISPNTGATNISGFTALPGGFRGSDGSFQDLTKKAHIWSSKMFDASNSWYLSLNYGWEYSMLPYNERVYGFSVRCLKD